LENRPREPWLAGVLTFFAIGLGHIYFGDVKKGIIFLCGMLFGTLALSFLIIYLPICPIIVIISITYLVYCIVDAVQGARVFKGYYHLKKYNRWYIYILYWVVATFIIQIFLTSIRYNIVQSYKTSSGSMRETLQIGDNIIVNKFVYKISVPKRGDIIIFPYPVDPSKNYTKRIIGLGGETIEVIDKKVIINGGVLQEPYVHYDNTTGREKYGPIKIPEDSLFVMGDNRDNSSDSRDWGFLKKASVKGRAIKICWSWDNEKFRVRWNRIDKEIK
jgi:signal peptidase I